LPAEGLGFGPAPLGQQRVQLRLSVFGRCEERLDLLDGQEFVSYVVEEGGPIAWGALAEDPQGGIPG
jgi:hypothetical protein